jgi:hypothetical protein
VREQIFNAAAWLIDRVATVLAIVLFVTFSAVLVYYVAGALTGQFQQHDDLGFL